MTCRAMRDKDHCLTLIVCCLAFIGSVSSAGAAESQPADTLQEVVVTAEKRESTVQNTPISLTAVSGDEIQERGIADFVTLAESIPGVSMHSNGPGQTEFEMRGMSSTGGNSPTVGFYFEDTPLTGPALTTNGKVVLDPSLYDLNRVEVLRGPQGTLYGSGSMGGTIKLIPNAPNPQAFDASTQFTAGDTDAAGFDHAENGMINIPIGSNAALRLVASHAYDSGWIDRIVIANGAFPTETDARLTRGNVLDAPVAQKYDGVNDSNVTGARASILWKPSEQVSITPTFLYQRIEQNGLNDIDSNPGTLAHYQPFDFAEPFSDDFHLGSLNISYHFDSFDITSTTSYWNDNLFLNEDASEQWQWALDLPFYTDKGGLGVTSTNLENDRSNQTTEELRVTSSGTGPLRWLLGYFYQDFEQTFGIDIAAPGGATLFGTPNLFTDSQPTKVIQNSFFGEASYQLTSTLRFTAGLRRYYYDSSFQATESGVVATGSNAISHSSGFEGSQGLNPKVDLSFQPTSDLLVYATAAKGFRPGGGNTPIPTSGTVGAVCEANLQANFGTNAFVASPLTFGPDDVWSYELGEKAKMLGGRVSLNTGVYFENWARVQQTIPIPCGYAYQANAGDAHVYGGEVELQALLTTGLLLSASTGYSHATLASATILDAGLDLGSRLENVPEWTSSVSLAYRHPITGDLGFLARIQDDFVGSRTDATYAINQLPSYNLAYLRTGVETKRWSAILFAKNLFNKSAYLNNINQISVNLPTYNRVSVSQPLTIGIDLSYRFGR